MTSTASSDDLQPDFDEADKFLRFLDPEDESHVFQTFSDREKGTLAKTRPGTFAMCKSSLASYNRQGAGVFVTVNKVEGQRRQTENIVRVRAFFADLDKAPLGNLERFPLKPSLVVESSPGKHQAYWFISDGTLDNFSVNQKKLAQLLSSDEKVIDLPRVMRLPGFFHQKGTPFKTRIVDVVEPRVVYMEAQVLEALQLSYFTNYGRAQLEQLIDKFMKNAEEGTRNTMLNETAFLAGSLIDEEQISREEAETLLVEAGEKTGLARSECIRTVRSGLDGWEKQQEEKGEAEDKDEDERRERKIEKRIREFNKNNAVVVEGGKTRILRIRYDEVTKRIIYDRMLPVDFKNAYNKPVLVIDPKSKDLKWVPFGNYWFGHLKRREYLDGVVFDPTGKERKRIFNLWRGFAVDAVKGSIRHLVRHLYKIVCSRNREYFKYLVRWAARTVQRPDEPGMVAVVLQGKEGVGKGVVALALVKLFGQHGEQIYQASQLVGHFNAHLQDCVVLFADEAFFAGDKQHAGALKGLITEPTLAIEGKGRDIVMTKNYTHLIIASNEDWVIPAGLEARRFFPLTVGDVHRGDTGYFGKLFKEIDEEGGLAALLYYLKKVDLEGFNVFNFPKTEALVDQQKRSLPTHKAWLRDVLIREYVEHSPHCAEAMDWNERVTTRALYESYSLYARARNEKRLMLQEYFGKFLSEMGFKPFRARQGFWDGEERDAYSGWQPRTSEGKRCQGYFLGDLATAREKCYKETGLAFPVDDGDGEPD